MIREHFDASALIRALAWAAAVAVLAAGAYVVVTRHGAAIVDALDASISTFAPKKETRSADRAAPDAARQRPSPPSVYRCQVNGAVTYSDTPCPGGEVIELVVPKGFEPTPAPGAPRKR